MQRFGEDDLAGEHDLFGGAGDALQPRQRAVVSFIDDAAVYERLVFAVREAQQTEIGGVFDAEAHHARIRHRPAVVADGDRASLFHLAHFGQLLALFSDGDGADGMHLAHPRLFSAGDDIADDSRVVADGSGVGHAADLREPAVHRRRAAAGDVFFILKTRLAQVDVHVDQAGEHVQPRGVDRFRLRVFDLGGDAGDLIPFRQNIADLAAVREHGRAAFDQVLIHSFRLPVCF